MAFSPAFRKSHASPGPLRFCNFGPEINGIGKTVVRESETSYISAKFLDGRLSELLKECKHSFCLIEVASLWGFADVTFQVCSRQVLVTLGQIQFAKMK
jgi:hypothetical protein